MQCDDARYIQRKAGVKRIYSELNPNSIDGDAGTGAVLLVGPE
jgi:hypothetical protein